MTSQYQAQYYSMVICDACHQQNANEEALFDSISEAIAYGAAHMWAVRDGSSHYCDDCWCEEHDHPMKECTLVDR